MLITHANVGDIIRLDAGAQYIEIEEVTDRYVQYLRETGHRYATFEHEISGTIIRDKDRIDAFKSNSALGEALTFAEHSAIYNLICGLPNSEQRNDAYSVLKSVKAMKQHLTELLARHRDHETGKPRPHASLDSQICNASTGGQEQPIAPQPGRKGRPVR